MDKGTRKRPIFGISRLRMAVEGKSVTTHVADIAQRPRRKDGANEP